jgi:hypothetical protein
MKTTLEIPNDVFRLAKAKAAEQGIPLRQFVTEAVAERLRCHSGATAKDKLLPVFGKLRNLRKETARINRIIEEEFERIDPEDWE